MLLKKTGLLSGLFLFIEKENIMSYKYSKGSQVIGDLKAADDAERNTLIDFGEDQIEFQTSGSTRLKVENTTTTITNTLHLSGSVVEALRIAKGDNDYKQIVFENDGVDSANIQLSNGENLVFQNETNGKDIQFWVNPTAGSTAQAMVIKEDLKVGIGTDTPDYTLDVAGDIGVNQHIYHNSDANTFINFTDNRIRLNAGGNNFIDCEDNDVLKVKINNGGNNIDFAIKDKDGNVYFTADASTAKIGIGTDTPSHKLDVDGDIRVRGNDIRDNSGNPAITFDGSANTSVVNDLTVGGNVFDANNKSVIKLVDHGACLINEADTSERFLPDDIFHDYGGSNLYTTNVPPFSGSVDRLVVRGVNNSDLSLLGDLTAKVKIGGEGTNSYTIDTHPASEESVTILSSNLDKEKNCVFVFTGSNFTPQDIYLISLTPTNNWTSVAGGVYLNFTIVTSYIID